jgi:dipeptidyl aminopeptidase/acylaminoacyl peptidase
MFYAVYTHRFNTSIAPFNAETGVIALEEARALLGSYISPVWSPTGEFLAVVSQEEVEGAPGTREFLVVLSVETGEERKLAPNVDLGYARKSWSPDGRFILVQGSDWSQPGPEKSALWRVDVASGEATAVVDSLEGRSWGFPASGAVWTPNSDGFIYADAGRIALRDLASGQETELYRNPRLAHRLIALSPDGRQLAFGVTASQQHDPGGESIIRDGGRILSMPAEGGEVRELATITNPGRITGIDWTPDGEYVLFWQEREKGGAFLRIPRGGGELEELWATSQSMAHVHSHPGSGRVAYTTTENEVEIWVMENLVAVLNQGSGG